ncbi:three-Cys-motif partner protein TcmP [uncultured Acetobacteroides sp.]|uniref:three-Cys-motif partner protein TcmP n=1 Tax=uncultured Acetobacteroides sp. TaxID=1760811 RepID=UPI0029F4FFC3|nr:three-Cys-motif partner protein TcmP [uncultured Acetobacteroides sp.]
MEKQKKTDAKKTMLPHSKAKLEYYQFYLKRYLTILRLADFTNCINIFDVFCGTGIYEDGTKGSPILAFEAIEESSEKNNGKKLAPVSLIVNDIESVKIDGIQKYLTKKNNDICKIIYHNEDADSFLSNIENTIGQQQTNERNLILIDPYGYKKVRKENIKNLLLKKRNTEIMLFLPISQIYRFTGAVINDEDTKVKALKDFIDSFFPDKTHSIYNNCLTHEKELIEYIRQALMFEGKFYATSYYIQRDTREHYYALFSITPNIYGLEKNLEVKWKLNEESGEGFEQPKAMLGLFDNQFKEEAQREQYDRLKDILLTIIEEKGSIDNNQLYEITLKNMFLPKHSKQVLIQLQEDNIIEVIDVKTMKDARHGAFYQCYNNYSNRIVKIRIKKKENHVIKN